MSNTLNCSQREMFNIKSVTASFILLKVISILSWIAIKKALFSLNSVKDKTLLQQKHCQEHYAERKRTNPAHHRSSPGCCYQQIFKQSLLYLNITVHSIVWKPKEAKARYQRRSDGVQRSFPSRSHAYSFYLHSRTMLRVQKILLTWCDFL